MLREMILNANLHEIPKIITTTPNGSVVMTRNEMNDLIDKRFNTITDKKERS